MIYHMIWVSSRFSGHFVPQDVQVRRPRPQRGGKAALDQKHIVILFKFLFLFGDMLYLYLFVSCPEFSNLEPWSAVLMLLQLVMGERAGAARQWHLCKVWSGKVLGK